MANLSENRSVKMYAPSVIPFKRLSNINTKLPDSRRQKTENMASSPASQYTTTLPQKPRLDTPP